MNEKAAQTLKRGNNEIKTHRCLPFTRPFLADRRVADRRSLHMGPERSTHDGEDIRDSDSEQ